jgi:hypothetical protein
MPRNLILVCVTSPFFSLSSDVEHIILHLATIFSSVVLLLLLLLLLFTAVPGTYKVDRPAIRIRHFHPQLTIITSKQRPRKIQIKVRVHFKYLNSYLSLSRFLVVFVFCTTLSLPLISG